MPHFFVAPSSSSLLPPSPPFPTSLHFLRSSPIRIHSSSSFSQPSYNNSISSSASSSVLTTKVEDRSISQQEKLLVIMGTTGSGKSKLSIDLSTTGGFHTEIVNCDKIHIYKGLDITTNKITVEEQQGVRHHLIGEFEGYFTPHQFRLAAKKTVTDISSKGNLPVLVGGSNSFIHAVVAERFHTGFKVFDGSRNRISPKLRYDTCFIWIDVAFPVLFEYLDRRVDKLVEAGMVEELAEFFASESWVNKAGLVEAICVPEFEHYFELVKNGNCSDAERKMVYEEAVREVKENTCHLAERQIEKITQLKRCGWNLHRIDATEAVKVSMESPLLGDEVWEREVVQPSAKIVKQFLDK
ncbi:Adenylate isopentenyltransferase [Linum perenne]